MASIYVAGPMRGYDRFNFPAFDEASAWLRAQGHTVFSPAEHDRETGFDESQNSLDGFDLTAAFRWDIDRIFEVDTIVLLPDWEKSTGVAAELAVAKMLSRTVMEYKLAPVLTPLAA